MQKFTTVTEFLESLDDNKKAQVLKIRELIMVAEPKLEERIKWNAPSYVFDGEDRITFNLLNKEVVVKLVLHMGATRKENKKALPIMNDDSGLMEWSSDIRGMVTFRSMDEVTDNGDALVGVIKRWLAIVA